MYPTALAGLALLYAALQHLRAPDRRRRAIVSELSWLVGLTSCLGFVTGVIMTFTHVGGCDPRDITAIALAGIGESMVNIGLGLVVLAIARILLVCSNRPATAADLTDPHAP